MNPISKKFISFFLIFSLIMLSGNLYAKKRGAELVITKKNGFQERGELIVVKKDSLLLLFARRIDVSVSIENIKAITIVKKSKSGTGALIGVVVGGGGGALLSLVMNAGHEPYTIQIRAILTEILGGLGGLLIGAMLGAGAGADKEIRIERMNDLYIQEILDKLRKKARIRDYK
jgi:hypothetical protein